jgi:hypothetical protein
MKVIQINEPIWKDRSVGLNVHNMSPEEEVEIDILYIEKKTGKRLYPDTYRMTVEDILKYPSQRLKANVLVYLIPIASLNRIAKNQEDKSQLKLF